MKKVLALLFLLCAVNVSAQDVIDSNGRNDNYFKVDEQYSIESQYDNLLQYDDCISLMLDTQWQNGGGKSPGFYYKKANVMIGTAVIGSLGLLATSLVFLYLCEEKSDFWSVNDKYFFYSLACVGASGAWLWGFWAASNYYARKGDRLLATKLYEHKFNLGNGTSFSAGVDILRDNIQKNEVLGLGFHYDF